MVALSKRICQICRKHVERSEMIRAGKIGLICKECNEQLEAK